MLHIKHKLQIDFPHIVFIPHHEMQLSPIEASDDELLREIEQHYAEDTMNLDEADGRDLENFWNGVSSDLKSDPEWFDFAED